MVKHYTQRLGLALLWFLILRELIKFICEGKTEVVSEKESLLTGASLHLRLA